MNYSVKSPSSMPRAIVNVVVILAVAFVVQRIASKDNAEPTLVTESQENDAAKTAQTAPLVHLRITGATSTKGTIHAALFFDDEAFPNNESAAYAQSVDAAHMKQGVIAMNIAFEHFAADTPFAIAVYHDANNDGIMNKSLVGVPTETYGFTNDARSTFGPPTFDQAALAALDLAKSPHTIDVRLK